MSYGVEIQGHGRVGFDDFSVLDAYVAVVDQLLQAVNELWRDAVAMFVAKAPSGHDGRDGGVEIAVRQPCRLLCDIEVVDKDGVERYVLVTVDFGDDRGVDPQVDRNVHGMEDGVDVALEVAAQRIIISDGIVGALRLALEDHLFRLFST